MRSLMVIIALGMALSGAGCEESRRRLQIKITHPKNDNPALEGDLYVAVYEVTSDGKTHIQSTDQAIKGSLENPLRVLEEVPMEVGKRYEVVVWAEFFDADHCAKERAVGVSAPFVYQETTRHIPVFVDCADRSSTVAESLAKSRLYHTATFVPAPAPHGRVVIAGGIFPTTGLDDPELLHRAERIDSIEIYDPGTESFSPLKATMTTKRGLHSAVAVGDDVLLIGGYNAMEVAGSLHLVGVGDVDRVVGDKVDRLDPLSGGRALAGVALLDDKSLLVAGGGGANLLPQKTAELYAAMAGAPLKELPEMNFPRSAPAVVRAGELALLIGGAFWPTIQLVGEAFCPEGKSCDSCAKGPCFNALPTFPKGKGRSNLAAAHVACEDGSGATYVVGGSHGDLDDPNIQSEVYKDIYCVQDDKLSTGLELVGQMSEARQNHTVTVVRGVKGQRLFVAGGSIKAEILKDTAELIPAACTCEEIDPGRIEPVALNGRRVGHTATLLADGSVLLIGGFFDSRTAERFVPNSKVP